MIQVGTVVKVTDNSGAQKAQCIRVLHKRKAHASIGDVIVAVVKQASASGKADNGKVYRAVIVRTKKSIRRIDGTYISFADNAIVLLDKQHELIGTRVIGPVTHELRKSFIRIVSLAKEVL